MPPNQQKSSIGQFFIQVDGSNAPPEVMNALQDAVVEDDIGQPAMFALRFHDPNLTLTDGDQFKLGREVTLGAAAPGGQQKTIMTGEITALEPEFEQHTPTITVRGYDRSHRLYRGRKTRTFLNQTDSDIASQIAREAGLTVDAEATSAQHAYVIQDNQTDMDFLRARAARIGYSITADERKLRFRRAEASPPAAPAQEWGLSLRTFRVRLTAIAQPNDVQVRGWDPKMKRAIVGKATQAAKPSQIGDGKTGGEAAQESFGSAATLTVTNQPVRTQGEADYLAQATLDELSGGYLVAEGLCNGEPALKAGTTVEISGVGTRLGGKYFVTATRHEYTPKGGYTTIFTVNGRQPRNLVASVNGHHGQHRIEGVVIGVVTNINDPDKLGRVKVKFPWLDEGQESDWARLVGTGGGKDRGFMVVPEVEDEVLVAFEHGDINRPYIIGGLWNSKDTAPVVAVAGGKVEQRIFKTRVGHQIVFKDDAGPGFIQIKTAGGHLININDTDKQIQIKSQSHTVLLDDQGKAVKITSGGDVEIKGTGGQLTITSSGVELRSNSGMTVQANSMLDVKSSAALTIQGAMVKIN
ncbi:MAG TPA: VgrG-related protein [Herpetosiphonaceae bacterium]